MVEVKHTQLYTLKITLGIQIWVLNLYLIVRFEIGMLNAVTEPILCVEIKSNLRFTKWSDFLYPQLSKASWFFLAWIQNLRYKQIIHVYNIFLFVN